MIRVALLHPCSLVLSLLSQPLLALEPGQRVGHLEVRDANDRPATGGTP